MIFCYFVVNKQFKCGIFYEKTTMREGDDEQIIMNFHYKNGNAENFDATLAWRGFNVSLKCYVYYVWNHV